MCRVMRMTRRTRYKYSVLLILLVAMVVWYCRSVVYNGQELKQQSSLTERDYVLYQEIEENEPKVINTNTKRAIKTTSKHNSVKIFKQHEHDLKGIHWEVSTLKTLNGKTPVYIYRSDIDKMISSFVKDYGTWEEDLLNQTAKIFQKYKQLVFLDLGCNIGVYTLFIAKLNRKVIAIDAVADNLKLLSNSLTAGRLQENVTLIHNAISDKHGTISVDIPKGNIGGAHVVDNDAELDGDKGLDRANIKTNIETITIDDLIPFVKGKDVFIKIDIEGFECRAFSGAHNFFQSVNVRGILMEWVHHRYRDSGQAIIDILMKNGLFPYTDMDNGKLLDPEIYHRWPENLFWIKR